MTYGAAQGTTTFSGTGAASLTWIGWNNSTGASGGTAAASTVQVTGATLNLNGSYASDGDTQGLWVGDSVGTTAGAILTINGGNVVVTGGTLLGRDGAKGTLNVSNGSFSTGFFSSTVGMYIGSSNGGMLAAAF